MIRLIQTLKYLSILQIFFLIFKNYKRFIVFFLFRKKFQLKKNKNKFLIFRFKNIFDLKIKDIIKDQITSNINWKNKKINYFCIIYII